MADDQRPKPEETDPRRHRDGAAGGAATPRRVEGTIPLRGLATTRSAGSDAGSAPPASAGTDAAPAPTAATPSRAGKGDGGGGGGGAGRAPGGGEERNGGHGMFVLPISAALTLGFGSLVAIAVALVLYLGLSSGRDATLGLLRDKTELMLANVTERIRLHVRPARDQAAMLAASIARGNIPPDDFIRMSDFITASLGATPQISGVVYFNVDGSFLRVGRKDDGIDIEVGSWSDIPEAVAAVNSVRDRAEPFWGEIAWAPGPKRAVINLRTPVIRDGKFVGAVVSGITVNELSRFLNEQDDPLFFNTFVLYGSDRVLAHRALVDDGIETSAGKPLPRIFDVGDPILNKAWHKGTPEPNLAGLNGPVYGTGVTLGSSEYVILYRLETQFGDVPWVIGAYFPLADIDLPLRRLIEAGIAGGIVLLVAVGLALLLGRGVARPVRGLAAGARHIEEFDFEHVPTIDGGAFRETRDAANAFNNMMAAMRAFAIYVPRSLVQRLIRQGQYADVPPEKREVTVLFTDIVGFTTFAEGYGPTDAARFLNDHFKLVTECIEESEGTVDKYIGDSVMAFWGAPGEQPDHAVRAARCALAIVDRLAEDNAARTAEGKPPVRIRIAIHTGNAIVGNVGGPIRVDYTLVGDTVNTASRLVDLARRHLGRDDPAVVIVSQRSAREIGDTFDTEDLGEEDIRGRQGRIGICRLKGMRKNA